MPASIPPATPATPHSQVSASSDHSVPVLEIRNLETVFHGDDHDVRAVDGISLTIAEGRTLGLVGESGSGKSVTSLSVMRLLPAHAAEIVAGEIAVLGQNVLKLPSTAMRKVRGGQVAMIFQEPGTSLNPVYRVGAQVAEAIQLHQDVSKVEARNRTIALFREVGIPDPERRVDSYPHEMSGGQKQRVMIAMALSCNPKLLIADEPTTALDVTIQAQILDLIRRLRDERGMAILFITHDLGVIAEIADDVAVMFRGKLVETGDVETIFKNPRHPYTRGLLACRPRLESPFRRLPTVADFLNVPEDARPTSGDPASLLSPTRIKQLREAGRGRLLHPQRELEALCHPFSQDQVDAGTQVVPANEQPMLAVSRLKVHFPIRKGVFSRISGYVHAVDGVSFNVYRGQTLGLVGESGCGKTTTGRAILRLTDITEGLVMFSGERLSGLQGEELRTLRRKIQIIFQDPYSSLNPRMTVEATLTEPMAIHRLYESRGERRDRAASLLQEVGLGPEHLQRYPHEFSGGQRQRIGIARALAVEPEFIVCDESVSALDVSVQAQVLNLLKDLQEKRGLTYIFISHDLSVVKFMADMMAVMNAGKIVEFGPSDSIYANPQQDYTKKLIAAIPEASYAKIQDRKAQRIAAAEKRTRANVTAGTNLG